MGSTNLETENDARRRMAAREMLTNTLPTSRDRSPAYTNRNKRAVGNSGTFKANLALSGQTTTARGHIIVPPTKAKKIAFEYEHISDNERTESKTTAEQDIESESASLASAYVTMEVKRPNGDITNRPDARINISREKTTRYEFGNISRKEKYSRSSAIDDGSRRVNNANKTVSADVDESTVLRAPRIDRNHRSLLSAPVDRVPNTKSEGASRTIELRDDAVRKIRTEADTRTARTNTGLQRDQQRNIESAQVKTTRRRRGRAGEKSNELSDASSKQSTSGRKPVANFNALGNAPTAKRLPFLPTYIQPVAEQNISRQSNRMIYSPARTRKISTEMNRYESSSSSSSSSSESERESPVRPVNKVIVENIARSLNPAPETPDTSDAEKRRPEGRRRRGRRGRVVGSAKSERSDDRLSGLKDNGANRTGRVRTTGGVTRRARRRPDLTIPLEDKYVSLPDNYKQPEFVAGGDPSFVGDKVQLVDLSNSQGDAGEEHSNDSSRSTRDAELARSRESNKTTLTSGSRGSTNAGQGKENTSRSTADRLLTGEKIEHRKGNTGHLDDRRTPGRQLVGESVKVEHVGFSVSSPEPNSPQRDSEKPAEEQFVGRAKRSSSGGESRGLGNIRSKFENDDAPKGDFGQSFLKRGQYGHDSAQRRVSKGGANNTHESAVIQSQPKIQARKVSEDYWPRDEATERLLRHSRTTSTTSTSPPTEKDYETVTSTIQDTIDGLHRIAVEDTLMKSRFSSTPTLNEYTKSNEADLKTGDLSLSTRSLAHSGHRNSRSGPISRSRVQMVKVPQMDVSPCMSSTETLKECSSGEYQGKNSRSPSIDSTTSNPETILTNASLIKERNVHGNGKQYGQSTSIRDKDDLFIEEGQEGRRDDLHLPLQDTAVGATKCSASGDVFTKPPNSSKSMLEQMKGLTESLQAIRSLQNIKKAQPLNTANLQKANVLTVPILNVSSHMPCLETLSEDLEPPSPDSVRKNPVRTHTYTASKDKLDDSLEIDEGIVTKAEPNQDPKSYLQLEKKLEESNKRTNRSTSSRDSGDNNGNESARSLSDPSADRKRSPPGESSVDSNLLCALQTGHKEDMGLCDHTSLGSSSQFSEGVSSHSETLNAELFNEEPEFSENEKNQSRSGKKKSKSDPNPEGFINLDPRDGKENIIEDDRIQSASSEPNVTEQSDELGPLDQFKKYQNNKATQDKSPAKLKPVEEEIFQVYGDKHAHVSPRNMRRKQESMKSKKRAQNVENSIISQLMADSSRYNNKPTRTRDDSNQSSSTPSPVASEETSPTEREVPETLRESEEQFFEMYTSMKSKDSQALGSHGSGHARSNSEPVQMMTSTEHIAQALPYNQSLNNRGRRAGIIEAPSLDNVGTRYSTAETASLHSEIHEPVNYHHSQSEDTVFSPSKESYGFSPIQEKRKPEMRLHPFKDLLVAEESYVSSLRILYQDYMTPLKHPENHSTCEPRLVDEIFYKIPQLYQHHEKFYENLQQCYENWNSKDVRLGELFLNSFNKDALLDTYSAYITNYLNAREAVRTAEAKEAFRRFIEQCRSENKEKQGLADLMIKPVQRIPRYELVIEVMLKHTPEGHPDREGLLIAQKEIHKLADQLNLRMKEAEAAERQDRMLTDLEQLLEGCIDLCVPKRRFLRQDIVTEIKGATKKDRSLWLFTDLIVCTTRKGKSGAAFRRGSMMNLTMGQDPRWPNIDSGYKYKFLWKFPLEDVEHLKGNTVPGRHAVDKQLQTLQNDMEILSSMHQQASKIECNHVQLDEALREIISYVRGQIADKIQLTIQPICPPGRVELGISTGDGIKPFLFEFLNDENKVQFERSFAEAKRCLTTQKNRWEPTFMKAIPISRTRSGMQFSCAAPNVDASPDVREVWVCNTDGYVGQVCFLTLEPELIQTQCITVCQAKICCITQVPTWEHRLVPAQTILQEVAKGSLVQPGGNPAMDIMSWDDPEDTDEENTSPHSTISSNSPYNQSPYSTINGVHHDNLASPDLVSLPGFIGSKNDQSRLTDGAAWKKHSNGSTLHGSLEDLLGEDESLIADARSILGGKDSMWLGTEGGKIHIYPSAESVRGSKRCVILPHSAAVHCILYHEGQVFVALSNGDLVIYARNITTGEWDFENQKTKLKVSSPYAINKMVIVEQNQLWCGCQNMIKIINVKELVEIDRFAVINENKRQICCMVCCGYGVWVALDKRPQIKLYHTVTHDLLADIDVSNPVNKMLASADAIIRQHKHACLRITALLVCNDLLWVGTSAGVVLTLTLPKITPHTTVLAMPVIPQGLAYGHTGHVRFLACAEIPDKEQNPSRRGSRRASTSVGKRRSSSSSNASNPSRKVSVIISGGDGYEDFRMNSTSESAGRDDSTNHLLVWRV